MSDWTCEPGQERYLERLAAAGALAEADRMLDAIERGDDLGPTLTADEVITRVRYPGWQP